MLALLCALLSALLYALASVLQQRGASEQAPEHSLRFGLLVRLVRHPIWLAGLVCDLGGYVFQFIALGNGPLVLVQPVLVCGLLFALPIGAAWAGRRLGRRDWVAAVMVCAGLAVFLTVANPSSGRTNASGAVWAALLICVAAVAAGLVLGSRTGGDRRRAFLLSAAAGVLYGAGAALTKTTAHLFGEGFFHAFTHWQLYLLVAFGLTGMVIGQSAFQAGTLDVSLPAMSVGDPMVSIVIGVLVFEEEIAGSPPAIVAEVVALIVMSLGIYLLARSEAQIDTPAGA